MSNRPKYLATMLKAGLWSALIQIPFVIMENFGVHTNLGSIGYIFYYPWILVLDRFSGRSLNSWQNNVFLFEAVLFVLQGIFLTILIFAIIALINRSKSDAETH